MKRIFFMTVFIILFGQFINAQEKVCSKNSDSRYSKKEVLTKLINVLNELIPNYDVMAPRKFHINGDKPGGFLIYDLTDPNNKSVYKNNYCIDFIDGHVYHFSPIFYPFSKSFIAILQKGSIKIFKEINCGDFDENLKEVIKYVEKNLPKNKNTKDTIMRIGNYRRYGYWIDIYQPLPNICKVVLQVPQAPDKSYSRYEILPKMSGVLYKYLPKSFDEYTSFYTLENEQAIGFYVQDLVDLKNKQTNLLEFVDFKEGHIYQFGWIDAPYSLSHFAVLKNGEIHFFEAIDCKSKAEGLDNLINFIKENFEAGENRRKLIERVKEYQKYRIAIKFENSNTPRCNQNSISVN